jgi:hypothetical protein
MKIYFSFILVFSLFLLVGATEPPSFNQAQTSAYDTITNTELTQVPNLDGLSNEELSGLIKNKVNDPKYADFISRLSEKDFDRALEKDPSLLRTVNNDGSSPVLNRLDKKIASEPQYINRGSRLSGVTPGATDRRNLKTEWLKQKGFNEGGGKWGTVQIDSFNATTGMLGIKTSSGGVTKVDTNKVAEVCGQVGSSGGCINLRDDGSIRSANGIDLSNAVLEPSYYKGQVNFKVTKDGNQNPRIELGSFDPKSGQTVINVENAPGTLFTDHRGVLGASQNVVGDTSFKVETLGSGAIRITPTSDYPRVNVYSNVAGLTGSRKIMDLKGGAVEHDWNAGITKFTKDSSLADVFDSSGEQMFKTTFSSGDVLTTQTVQDLSKYKGVINLGNIANEDVVSVRDGLLRGPRVFAKPASFSEGLVLNDFQNGVYFQSDVSAGGKIVQKIQEGGKSAEITHEHGKGGYFSAGTPGIFRGVSESNFGKDKKENSRIVFDDGIIFGIGKDTVKVYPGKVQQTDSDGRVSYSYAGRQIFESVSLESSTPTPSVKPVVSSKTLNAANQANNARVKGFETRATKQATAASSSGSWTEFLDSLTQIGNLAPAKAKDKCPKITGSGAQAACGRASKYCKWESGACKAKD